MKKGNIVAAILSMALGIWVVMLCLGYPKAEVYGTGAPGPGLWPGLAGAGLFLAGTWILIDSLRKPDQEQEQLSVWGEGSKRVYLTMGILIIGVFLLPFTGFLPISFVLLVVFIQWFAKYQWYMTVGISAFTTLLVYAVFRFVLNVPIDFGVIAF